MLNMQSQIVSITQRVCLHGDKTDTKDVDKLNINKIENDNSVIITQYKHRH